MSRKQRELGDLVNFLSNVAHNMIFNDFDKAKNRPEDLPFMQLAARVQQAVVHHGSWYLREYTIKSNARHLDKPKS